MLVLKVIWERNAIKAKGQREKANRSRRQMWETVPFQAKTCPGNLIKAGLAHSPGVLTITIHDGFITCYSLSWHICNSGSFAVQHSCLRGTLSIPDNRNHQDAVILIKMMSKIARYQLFSCHSVLICRDANCKKSPESVVSYLNNQ